MDATAVCIVHEELASVDPAFCLSYLAHTLLFVNNLNVNGSQAQREAYLPRAISGEFLCGMAMSEPGAGTDVLGMSTSATRESPSTYTIQGRKMWITNGAYGPGELGDAFLVYARDVVPVGGAKRSYSLFLVDKGMPGFSLGSIIKEKCGMRASNTTELVLDQVKVPAATHLVSLERNGAFAVGCVCVHIHLAILFCLFPSFSQPLPPTTPPNPPTPPPPLPFKRWARRVMLCCT
jgi:isovaleryl-CoA dehydrogenase